MELEHANLDHPVHRRQVVELLDMYNRDAMGGGTGLEETVRSGLIEGLRRYPDALVLLAREQSQAIGLCIAFEGYSTFHARPLLNIHDIAVHPQYRNRGVGRALLAEVERDARRRGCCRITLEVRADNAGAQHLYRSAGFGESSPVMHFWHKTLGD